MATNNPVLAALMQGRREGKAEMREEVLTFLEQKYLDNKVERNTPEAAAILSLARELSEFMRVK